MPIAHIDCDVCCYAVASACENKRWKYKGEEHESKTILNKLLKQDGVDDSAITESYSVPEPWEKVKESATSYIENIISKLDMGYEVYISGKSNFRYSVATILPYKGNRSSIGKPYHLDNLRQFYVDTYMSKISVGMEADDAIGLAHNPAEDTIVTIDKDLNCIPGKHYNWVKDEHSDVSIVEADRNFYSQVITGDSTDNILGLYGLGSKSKVVEKLQGLEDDREMFDLVAHEYRCRFGSYWKQFMMENCKLLWILQQREPLWEGYFGESL